MSRAEYEVALEYAKCLSDKEVSVNLFRSYWTIKTQKKAIYRKLGISKDTELLWWLICKELGIRFKLQTIRIKGIKTLHDTIGNDI